MFPHKAPHLGFPNLTIRINWGGVLKYRFAISIIYQDELWSVLVLGRHSTSRTEIPASPGRSQNESPLFESPQGELAVLADLELDCTRLEFGVWEGQHRIFGPHYFGLSDGSLFFPFFLPCIKVT